MTAVATCKRGAPWADCLVLRGSMPMDASFGDSARATKDID
ncbi:hypothetical protein [Streptomyces sp. E-08]